MSLKFICVYTRVKADNQILFKTFLTGLKILNAKINVYNLEGILKNPLVERALRSD